MVPQKTSLRSNAGRPEPTDVGPIDVDLFCSWTRCRMRSKIPLLTAHAGHESQEPMRRMERDRERLRRGLSRVSITTQRAPTTKEQFRPEPKQGRRALITRATGCKTTGRTLPRRSKSLNEQERKRDAAPQAASKEEREACEDPGIPLKHLNKGVRKQSTTLHHRQLAHESREACKYTKSPLLHLRQGVRRVGREWACRAS